MGLIRLGPAGPRAAAEAGRLGGLGRAFGQIGEARLGERDQSVMIDLARRDQGQAAGAVMVRPPGVEVGDR